jgi:hypothetical protein
MSVSSLSGTIAVPERHSFSEFAMKAEPAQFFPVICLAGLAGDCLGETSLGDNHMEQHESRKEGTDRRAFLSSAGKFAVVVPPAMTMLLSTTMNSPAIAQSAATGGGGGATGGDTGGSTTTTTTTTSAVRVRRR